MLVLLADEEEQLALVLVEFARDEDRAADREPEVPLVERGNDRIGQLVALEILAGGVAVDPGVGVEAVVAAVGVSRSVEVPGSALGHGADLRADRPAVLGLVVRGEDLDLLDRVDADRHHRTAVVAGVDVGDAIEGHVVGARTLSVGAQVLGFDAGGVRHAVRDHSGGEEGHVEETATVDRDLLHALAGNREGAFGARGLQESRIRGDADRLGETAQFDGDGAERHPVVGIDDQLGPRRRLEPVGLDQERVGLRRHVGEHEVPGLADGGGETVPRSSLVRVTTAVGMPAPCGSFTDPETVPLVVWAARGKALMATNAMAAIARLNSPACCLTRGIGLNRLLMSRSASLCMGSP